MSNGLDPDQDGRSVGPDLDPNCLQRLSADDKSMLATNELTNIAAIYKPVALPVNGLEICYLKKINRKHSMAQVMF